MTLSTLPLTVSSDNSTKEEVVKTGSLPVNFLKRLSDSWLMACDIAQHSAGTLANRRGVVNKLIWFLSAKGYASVDVHALRAFFHYVTHGHKEPGGRWGIAGETKPNKPGTVKTYHRILKTFFNWLVTEEEIPASPMSRIPVPIDRPDQVQPFTEAQVQSLLAAARGSRNAARDEAILLLMLDTGARASEVCALSVEDADLTGNLLTIKDGKGGKSRQVPFSRDTKRALYLYLRGRSLRDGDNEEPLFLAGAGVNDGGRLQRYGLLQVYERLGKVASLTGVRCSPHTMRHTFAVFFLRSGGGVFPLKAMLGHESLAMVNRYVALSSADVTRQHAQFSPVARLKGGKK